MNNVSVINQDVSQAQNQKSQDNAKVANSPFRYNTPYSNLAYKDINNSHRVQGKGKILPLSCSIAKFNRESVSEKQESKVSQKRTISRFSEIVAIDAAISKTVENINQKSQASVETELSEVAANIISFDNLGSDLEEADLDAILQTNNQLTDEMTLEEKQSRVVTIIQGLGEGSLEYKMAASHRLQLTKTKVIHYLGFKLGK